MGGPPSNDVPNNAPSLTPAEATDSEDTQYAGIVVSAPLADQPSEPPISSDVPIDSTEEATPSDPHAVSDEAEKTNIDLPTTLHKGEVVIITASSGRGGYLGVPGLKEQVYENRRAYAERWGTVP